MLGLLLELKCATRKKTVGPRCRDDAQTTGCLPNKKDRQKTGLLKYSKAC